MTKSRNYIVVEKKTKSLFFDVIFVRTEYFSFSVRRSIDRRYSVFYVVPFLSINLISSVSCWGVRWADGTIGAAARQSQHLSSALSLSV